MRTTSASWMGDCRAPRAPTGSTTPLNYGGLFRRRRSSQDSDDFVQLVKKEEEEGVDEQGKKKVKKKLEKKETGVFDIGELLLNAIEVNVKKKSLRNRRMTRFGFGLNMNKLRNLPHFKEVGGLTDKGFMESLKRNRFEGLKALFLGKKAANRKGRYRRQKKAKRKKKKEDMLDEMVIEEENESGDEGSSSVIIKPSKFRNPRENSKKLLKEDLSPSASLLSSVSSFSERSSGLEPYRQIRPWFREKTRLRTSKSCHKAAFNFFEIELDDESSVSETVVERRRAKMPTICMEVLDKNSGEKRTVTLARKNSKFVDKRLVLSRRMQGSLKSTNIDLEQDFDDWEDYDVEENFYAIDSMTSKEFRDLSYELMTELLGLKQKSFMRRKSIMGSYYFGANKRLKDHLENQVTIPRELLYNKFVRQYYTKRGSPRLRGADQGGDYREEDPEKKLPWYCLKSDQDKRFGSLRIIAKMVCLRKKLQGDRRHRMASRNFLMTPNQTQSLNGGFRQLDLIDLGKFRQILKICLQAKPIITTEPIRRVDEVQKATVSTFKAATCLLFIMTQEKSNTKFSKNNHLITHGKKYRKEYVTKKVKKKFERRRKVTRIGNKFNIVKGLILTVIKTKEGGRKITSI